MTLVAIGLAFTFAIVVVANVLRTVYKPYQAFADIIAGFDWPYHSAVAPKTMKVDDTQTVSHASYRRHC